MYKYRVTVESLSPETEAEKLQFTVENHDDIFVIVRRMARRTDLDESSWPALAVGLKLFSEVVLRNRTHPLFQHIQPALGEFMRELKR